MTSGFPSLSKPRAVVRPGARDDHVGAGHREAALGVVDQAAGRRVGLVQDRVGDVADMADAVLVQAVEDEQRPESRPDGALPVALITRLFPLLPGGPDSNGSGSNGSGGGGTG